MRTIFIVTLCLIASTSVYGDGRSSVVHVSAQSQVFAVPDEAIIEFSIVTHDDNLLIAKTDNDALSVLVVEALKGYEIPEARFKVTDLKLGPHYSSYHNPEGYDVIRSFEIRTKEFSTIDPLIGSIVDVGENNVRIHQLKLQVSDQRPFQFEARRLAVEYATEKASDLAELNHMKLGKAISITEGVEYNYDAVGMGGMGGGMSTGLEDHRSKHLTALPKSGESQPRREEARPLIRLVSQKQHEKSVEKPTEKQKAVNDTNQKLLLSPGQVSLNATVTIEFQLVPME
ncbi:MAG: SIMPL domain-containing protein [Planctomycetota bacterium]|nr:SIMPL domain-containing protein [Planctomycetota bacterium]MDA1213599.1 SIMPL domain-containing protein [Planctomycetota bacterium]